jgi:hypothetical protein
MADAQLPKSDAAAASFRGDQVKLLATSQLRSMSRETVWLPRRCQPRCLSLRDLRGCEGQSRKCLLLLGLTLACRCVEVVLGSVKVRGEVLNRDRKWHETRSTVFAA